VRIEVLQNGTPVLTRELGDGTYKVGRASSCEIQLKSSQVSKQHALLVIKNGRAAIADLGSANGIFVNGILVKKQRVEATDEVRIVDFVLRFSSGAPAGLGAPPPRMAAAGNAAFAFQPQTAAFGVPLGVAEAPAELPPQERFLQLMDEKVLQPFYGVVKTADWRWLLAVIILLALLSSVLLSVLPVLEWGRGITRKEALQRAHTIANQVVRENHRVLSKENDEGRLTVQAAEAEKGVLNVLIVDPDTKTILSPAKYLGRGLTDGYSMIGLKTVAEGEEDEAEVEMTDNVWIVAHPIRVYSPETNENKLRAVVLLQFQVTTEISSIFQPMAGASLYAILFSLAAFFLIFKMISRPISRMQQQLDSALKGENVQVVAEAKMEELDQLATTINFAIARIKQGGGAPGDIAVDDDEGIERAFVKTVEEFDGATGDALLLLDRDKRVRFIGKATEELLNMRTQYALGQNISDACKDPGFAGTAIDLCERVLNTLGEAQHVMLDINGIARNMSAVGHRDAQGNIRFILVVVKLGGGA
jgi:hypothetical protein